MNDSFDKKQESVYSKRLKAGKRRTYFFDVRSTRGNDYFLTITESRKRMTDDGYDRHKIFLYKEDFHKFMRGLNEAIDYVKTELMPDFDFDSFNHDTEETDTPNEAPVATKPTIAPDLLQHGVFQKQAQTDSVDGVDGIDGLDGHKVNGVQLDGHSSEVESAPVIDGKPVAGTHTEDVDRW